MQQTWPDALWVVRHGESAGNVARELAERGQLERIPVTQRDVDVPLSDLGAQQARALGRWLGAVRESQRPTVLYSSPYLRAQQTAEIALLEADLDLPAVADERLREREFGILDGLTRRGIEAHFPEEAARRAQLGKFYHRPPGGESWTDTLLRVRSVLEDVRRDCVGERVLLVAHQVVVLLVRCVVEAMTEDEVLAVDAGADVANCSVTSYSFDPTLGPRGGLRLERFNEVEHLEQQDAPVTVESDLPAAPS